MRQFDYGYHGSPERGTDFWCFVTDVLVDGMLVVMTMEGDRLLIASNVFHHMGSLNDYINCVESIKIGEEIAYYAAETTLGTTYKASTLLSLYSSILCDVFEYAVSTRTLTVHPSPEEFITAYVTLYHISDYADLEGRFTKGHTYLIYRGCLLDEYGECYADQIRSVDDLNHWENNKCFWLEEPDFEEREKTYFKAENV